MTQRLASTFTQVKAMYWLRVRLFKSNPAMSMTLLLYPMFYLIVFVAKFATRNGGQVETGTPPEPLPFASLVPRPPSFIAGGSANQAALDALFTHVNLTVTQHRLRYEGRQSVTMIPTFWHRANTPNEVGALSRQLSHSNPSGDVFSPEITMPYGGFMVHSAPFTTDPSTPFNSSIVVRRGSGVPSIMLNALHNAVQDQMPANRSTNNSSSSSTLDRVFSLAQEASPDEVAPWLLRINGTQAAFRVHRTERFSTIIMEPAVVLFILSFMRVPTAFMLVSERLDGQFAYLTTNGLSPFTFYLGAMAGYMGIALFAVLYTTFLIMSLTWFWAVPGVFLLALFSAVVITHATVVSFLFSSKFSVFPTLMLLVFGGAAAPTYLIRSNLLPSHWASALTALFPTFAASQSLLEMVQAAMNFEPYRPFSSESVFLRTVAILVAHILAGLVLIHILANRAARDLLGINTRFSFSAAVAIATNLIRRALCLGSRRSHDVEGGNTSASSSQNLPKDQQLEDEVERIRTGGTSDDDVICIADLGVTFRNRMDPFGEAHQVVRNLSFTVRRNEAFAFLGPNGAGKSTTVNVLLGALKPTSGLATVCGKPPGDPSTQRLLGVCPQYDHAYPQLSVYDHMRTFGLIKGVPLDELEDAINRATFDAKLEPYLYRRVEELSGGTRRRMTIALACLGEPAVVILDEPTMGVDIASRRAIWDMITDLKTKSTIVLVTHEMDEAERLCERAGVMINGSLVCLGAPQRLKSLFGLTYRLKLQLMHAHKSASVRAAVETKVLSDGGKLLQVMQQNSTSLEFVFEMVDKQLATKVLADLLRFVNAQQAEWAVSDYALGEVTLSELFVRLAPYHHAYQAEEAMV